MNEKQSARFERFSEKCMECGGLGTITRYYGGGQFISTIDCEKCHGRGRIGNCSACAGTGMVQIAGDKGRTNEEPCADCLGVGSIGDCSECGGTGIDAAEGECRACKGFGFK